jgi:hypothetical protein
MTDTATYDDLKAQMKMQQGTIDSLRADEKMWATKLDANRALLREARERIEQLRMRYHATHLPTTMPPHDGVDYCVELNCENSTATLAKLDEALRD